MQNQNVVIAIPTKKLWEKYLKPLKRSGGNADYSSDIIIKLSHETKKASFMRRSKDYHHYMMIPIKEADLSGLNLIKDVFFTIPLVELNNESGLSIVLNLENGDADILWLDKPNKNNKKENRLENSFLDEQIVIGLGQLKTYSNFESVKGVCILGGKYFDKMLKSVYHASAQNDEHRPQFNGINFRIHDGHLFCAATESHKMALNKIKLADEEINHIGEISATIPISVFKQIVESSSFEYDDYILFSSHDKKYFWIENQNDGARVYTMPIDGKFPDYRNLLEDREVSFSVSVKKTEFFGIFEFVEKYNKKEEKAEKKTYQFQLLNLGADCAKEEFVRRIQPAEPFFRGDKPKKATLFESDFEDFVKWKTTTDSAYFKKEIRSMIFNPQNGGFVFTNYNGYSEMEKITTDGMFDVLWDSELKAKKVFPLVVYKTDLLVDRDKKDMFLDYSESFGFNLGLIEGIIENAPYENIKLEFLKNQNDGKTQQMFVNYEHDKKSAVINLVLPINLKKTHWD